MSRWRRIEKQLFQLPAVSYSILPLLLLLLLHLLFFPPPGLRLPPPLPLLLHPVELDIWYIRFIIGFKNKSSGKPDPAAAADAFFKAQQWRKEKNVDAIRYYYYAAAALSAL